MSCHEFSKIEVCFVNYLKAPEDRKSLRFFVMGYTQVISINLYFETDHYTLVSFINFKNVLTKQYKHHN